VFDDFIFCLICLDSLYDDESDEVDD
jgi:hypothetical protein